MLFQLTNMIDKIYITRLSRIYAAKRLDSREKFAQFLNIYYSCFSIFTGLYGLESKNDKTGSLMLAFSIIVTICMLYIQTLDYKKRAEKFKVNYIDLDDLLYQIREYIYELENKLVDEDAEKIKAFNKQYINLQRLSENHEKRDYISALHDIDYKKTNKRKFLKDSYYIMNFLEILVKLFFILIPFFLIIFIVFII